jgi:hypothetical protein
MSEDQLPEKPPSPDDLREAAILEAFPGRFDSDFQLGKSFNFPSVEQVVFMNNRQAARLRGI